MVFLLDCGSDGSAGYVQQPGFGFTVSRNVTTSPGFAPAGTISVVYSATSANDVGARALSAAKSGTCAIAGRAAPVRVPRTSNKASAVDRMGHREGGTAKPRDG